MTISLKSEVDCTHLPFNDNEFDLVVSQFGIEYADLDIAIPESLRVLKVNGSFSIVIHHEHSMVILRNRRIYTLLNALEVNHFFGNILNLVSKMGDINTQNDLDKVKSDKECEQLRKVLNKTIDTLIKLDESALKDSEPVSYTHLTLPTICSV